MVVAEQTGLENYAALCKSSDLVKKENHAKILSYVCAGLLAGFLRSGYAPARINPCACRLQPNVCDCNNDSCAPQLPTITPTATPTLTPTASPTAKPEPPRLELSILGCDTSIDLAYQMGEVTNAYVHLSNTGQSAASKVCALLSASDESRQHPDNLGCVLSLPAGYQVTFKLTVDTGFGKTSLIRVDVSPAEKVPAKSIGA